MNRKSENKTKFLSLPYWQAAFVFMAFGIMVWASYLYVSNMQQKQLKRQSEDALAYVIAGIITDLKEQETVLGTVSETVRSMILQGDSYEKVTEYLASITRYITDYERVFSQVYSIYGVFHVFGEKFYISADWEPPQDYDCKERPWYKVAVEADGNVGVSEPYQDAVSGAHVVSFARKIFDDNGKPIAVVGLNLKLNNIREKVVKMSLAEGSYGILLNKSFDVIVHPSSAFFGKSLTLMNDGANIQKELIRSGGVSERVAKDYLGNNSILFTRLMENGWWLSVLTPIDSYYKGVRDMAWFLSALGAIMAAVLSFALLRLVIAKNEADEYARLMFEAMPLPCDLWDKKAKLMSCNREVLKMFGVKNLKEYEEHFSEFSPDYQPNGRLSKELMDEAIKKALQDGYRRFEWLHKKADGEQIPCEIVLMRLEYKGEYVIVVYKYDLRERKAAIEKMRIAEIAEESNKAKTRFLAMMSHEMRTPMNAIMGITEIQLEDNALAPKTHEALNKIYNSANLLLTIINDILDLSKAEVGKLELAPDKYDVASLIHDTVQLNMVRLGSKNIKFELKIDPKIPAKFIGDELRIKQVLNNLLTNAFKYTESGEVELTIESEYENKEKKSMLVFRVRDTGQGLTEEQLQEMFSEYSRFNLSANRAIQGTGLGMSITKRLVDMMEGSISVNSQPNKGSLFTVRLPQEVASEQVLGEELAENLRSFRFTSTTQRKNVQIIREPMPYGKVLIVDDVETNLYVAKGLMLPYKLSIDLAESGFEAIEKIKEGNIYDVIFMDHMMPKMDGIEAVGIIRGMGYTHPIVALTANAVAGQAEIFTQKGFNGFISKPVDIRQLNAVLNKLIRDKQNPEIIKEARAKYSIDIATPMLEIDPKLLEVFKRDAKKILPLMESTLKNINFATVDDLRLFTINVHALKSALANVGEEALSNVARKLEMAGKEGNHSDILSETPGFLTELRAVIQKFTLAEKDITASTDENPEFLQEKLLDIQKACSEYDKKAVKNALAELFPKRWSVTTKQLLNEISEYLLHSDFEKIAGRIKSFTP